MLRRVGHLLSYCLKIEFLTHCAMYTIRMYTYCTVHYTLKYVCVSVLFQMDKSDKYRDTPRSPSEEENKNENETSNRQRGVSESDPSDAKRSRYLSTLLMNS